MKIVNSSYEILNTFEDCMTTEEYLKHAEKHIEKIARTCYKSENLIKDGSAEKMIARLVDAGHEAMIEHFSISVKFTVDRGVSHEIVRHRLASFAQESTRYCNYLKDKFGAEITVIDITSGFHYDLSNASDMAKYQEWFNAMEDAEKHYFTMLALGATPEEARSVLPNSLKTEINVTMNLREWRHYFNLRCEEHAHPQIREVSFPLLHDFQKYLPEVFNDITC